MTIQTTELILINWKIGKKRTFNGDVYITRRERNRAYQNSLRSKAHELENKAEDAGRTA